MKIEMKLNPAHKQRLFLALDRVMKQSKNDLKFGLYRAATDLKSDYVSAIVSQDMPGWFPELSERYAAWKEKRVGHRRLWDLYGAVIKGINVENVRNLGAGEVGFFVGLPLKGLGSRGKNLHMYAYTVEYGEGKKPSRPIFMVTGLRYKGSGKLEKVMKQSLANIKAQWR